MKNAAVLTNGSGRREIAERAIGLSMAMKSHENARGEKNRNVSRCVSLGEIESPWRCGEVKGT
ncbi:MAG: hypothetical protein DCC46_01335 [Armatimonadetes bacterium]|nr:MAG: hypothetical protein DCC46_01335 [Armatimonadota bacterium]